MVRAPQANSAVDTTRWTLRNLPISLTAAVQHATVSLHYPQSMLPLDGQGKRQKRHQNHNVRQLVQ